MTLAVTARGQEHVELEGGYVIGRYHLKTGGAYTATKAGRIVAHHRFTNDTEQRTALQQCKDACAEDYGNETLAND